MCIRLLSHFMLCTSSIRSFYDAIDRAACGCIRSRHLLLRFFFAIASAGQQTLSWPAAGSQYWGQRCLCFSPYILALSDNFIFAFVCSYISFLWKPTGIVSPFMVVLLFIIISKRAGISEKIHESRLGVGFCSIYTRAYRLLVYFSYSFSVFWKAVFLSLFYPLVSLSHLFVPFRLMFRLSDWFISFNYPQFIHFCKYWPNIIFPCCWFFIRGCFRCSLLFLLYLSLQKIVNGETKQSSYWICFVT